MYKKGILKKNLASPHAIGLVETPELSALGVDYFFRMMTPKARQLARPYELEEWALLKHLLSNKEEKHDNLIVVGAGSLTYLSESYSKVSRYVAIEPLAKLFIPKDLRFIVKKTPKISVIEKKLQDVEARDVPNGNSVYAYIFNILAYIEHPIKNINRLIKRGDTLFITSWSQSKEAKKIRKKYFDYLNDLQSSVIIDPTKTIGLCHLDHFPFEKLKYYNSHQYIKGTITDTLVISTH